MPIGTTAAILGSAVIGAGASALSAGSASKAQQKAADQASQVTLAQLAQQQRQYDQDRADLSPYREAGYKALGSLGKMTTGNAADMQAELESDPGYQFRLNQGNRSVESSAASRGGVLSGATLKALARYNQGVASDEFGNRFNRLSALAGIGQTATNTGISAGGANSAAQAAGSSQIANNILSAGNARASQYVATGNAIGGAVGQVGNYLALRDLYRSPQTGYGGGAYGVVGSDGIY